MRFAIAFFILLVTHLAQAQDASDDTEIDSDAPELTAEVAQQAQVFLEEITVVGERTFFSIRSQITRAEDNLYSMFNDLNSDDDFDIVCSTIKTTSSYIPQRNCEPVFFTRHRQASARVALSEMRQAVTEEGLDLGILERSFDYVETDRELKAQTDGEFEALNEEIFRIASENPDYLEALMRVAKLKSVLEEERKERFGRDED